MDNSFKNYTLKLLIIFLSAISILFYLQGKTDKKNALIVKRGFGKTQPVVRKSQSGYGIAHKPTKVIRQSFMRNVIFPQIRIEP